MPSVACRASHWTARFAWHVESCRRRCGSVVVKICDVGLWNPWHSGARGNGRAIGRRVRTPACRKVEAASRSGAAEQKSQLGNDGEDCPRFCNDGTFNTWAHICSHCYSHVGIDESGVQLCLSDSLRMRDQSGQCAFAMRSFHRFAGFASVYGLLLVLSLMLAIANVLLLRTVFDYSFRFCNRCLLLLCIYISMVHILVCRHVHDGQRATDS